MSNEVKMRTIYLAGGCYWGVEKYMSCLKGVLETEVGFANGNTHAPTYQQVRYENTGHAETVRVVYDPEVLPLKALLRLFYKIIDPTMLDQQGEDVGHQAYNQPIVVEALPLEHFYSAEEYHQKYLDKNPGGYCHVPLDMIRWAKTADPAEYLKD